MTKQTLKNYTSKKSRFHLSWTRTFSVSSLLAGYFVLVGCATMRSPASFRTSGESYSPQLNSPSVVESNAPRIGEDFSFDWPVDRAALTRGFKVAGNGQHWGVDLAAPRGTEILASGDGEVIYVGKGFRGYGRLVIIEHAGHYATFYSHLQNFRVEEGDKVVRGDIIGTMGDSGNARGVHLHFEMREDRRPIDPESLLPKS